MRGGTREVIPRNHSGEDELGRNVIFKDFWQKCWFWSVLKSNLFKWGCPLTAATSKLATWRIIHIWGLPSLPEFQNYIALRTPVIIPRDSALSHTHTERTDSGSRFILITMWPALDQPQQGSGARVMCSALHAGGSSPVPPLPPWGQIFCRGRRPPPPLLRLQNALIWKESGLERKIGLGPKQMHHCLFLWCSHLWTGRSFR